MGDWIIPSFLNIWLNYNTRHAQIFRYLLIVLLIMTTSLKTSYWSTCSTSTSTLNTINSEQFSFSTYSNTFVGGVVLGQVSKSLYYLYEMYTGSSNDVAVRKINSSYSLVWMAAIHFRPWMKSITIDVNEHHIYFANRANQLIVWRLSTTDGAIVDAQNISILDSWSDDIKIHVLSDDSGYYVFGKDNTSIANIWKYLFSSSTSAQCQKIIKFSNNAYGQLKLSDTSFFLLGNDPSTFVLHMYRITFSSTTPDWANKMNCSSGSWEAYNSESLIYSSFIYSFFTYGASTKYLYFASMLTADGSVSLRYKSSSNCDTGVFGSAVSGNYIVVSVIWANPSLIIFNAISQTFTIKTSADRLYGWGVESITGK